MNSSKSVFDFGPRDNPPLRTLSDDEVIATIEDESDIDVALDYLDMKIERIRTGSEPVPAPVISPPVISPPVSVPVTATNSILGHEFTITQEAHTQTKEPLWVLRFKERIGTSDYDAVGDEVKRLGGKWYRMFQGFVFFKQPSFVPSEAVKPSAGPVIPPKPKDDEFPKSAEDTDKLTIVQKMKILKQELSAKFPTIKFSVSSGNRGSVDYTDGPSYGDKSEIHNILWKYPTGTFYSDYGPEQSNHYPSIRRHKSSTAFDNIKNAIDENITEPNFTIAPALGSISEVIDIAFRNTDYPEIKGNIKVQTIVDAIFEAGRYNPEMTKNGVGTKYPIQKESEPAPVNEPEHVPVVADVPAEPVKPVIRTKQELREESLHGPIEFVSTGNTGWGPEGTKLTMTFDGDTPIVTSSANGQASRFFKDEIIRGFQETHKRLTPLREIGRIGQEREVPIQVFKYGQYVRPTKKSGLSPKNRGKITHIERADGKEFIKTENTGAGHYESTDWEIDLDPEISPPVSEPEPEPVSAPVAPVEDEYVQVEGTNLKRLKDSNANRMKFEAMSTVQRNNAIKRELQRIIPGVNWTVVKEKYSYSGGIAVEWEDGPKYDDILKWSYDNPMKTGSGGLIEPVRNYSENVLIQLHDRIKRIMEVEADFGTYVYSPFKRSARRSGGHSNPLEVVEIKNGKIILTPEVQKEFDLRIFIISREKSPAAKLKDEYIDLIGNMVHYRIRKGDLVYSEKRNIVGIVDDNWRDSGKIKFFGDDILFPMEDFCLISKRRFAELTGKDPDHWQTNIHDRPTYMTPVSSKPITPEPEELFHGMSDSDLKSMADNLKKDRLAKGDTKGADLIDKQMKGWAEADLGEGIDFSKVSLAMKEVLSRAEKKGISRKVALQFILTKIPEGDKKEFYSNVVKAEIAKLG